MIDPELRDIIEPELQDREKLVWAEQIHRPHRDRWIQKALRGDRLRFPIGTIFAFTCLFFVLTRDELFLWEKLLFTFGVFIFGWSAWRSFSAYIKPQAYEQLRAFFGYALTSQRLIYVGTDKSTTTFPIDKVNAVTIDGERGWKLRLRHDSLQLWPAGGGFFKRYNIYFLEDFQKTKSELSSLLKERTS